LTDGADTHKNEYWTVVPPKDSMVPQLPSGLNHRSRKILFAMVTEYIATGAPVGSRTLSRKYAIDLSPATIRNVLSDLEESGFLKQPHTSAGRVPTELALRAFIEALVEFREVPRIQKREMRTQFDEIYAGSKARPDDILRRTGELVSAMSGTAAVVASSPAVQRKLSQMRFIRTKPDQMLAVLVFSDGVVENRYILAKEDIASSKLERIHNLLGDVVEGRTLGDVRDLCKRRLSDGRDEADQLRQEAFDLAHRAVTKVSRSQHAMVIAGADSLVELPEFGDADQLRKLMAALTDREHLVELLDNVIEAGAVTVYIGSEGELGDAQLSLVVAPYGDGDEASGTVGVLGPTRMDYARMMPLVDATAAAISAAIKKTR
jgi:heat-inducible transcriptional repressor